MPTATEKPTHNATVAQWQRYWQGYIRALRKEGIDPGRTATTGIFPFKINEPRRGHFLKSGIIKSNT